MIKKLHTFALDPLCDIKHLEIVSPKERGIFFALCTSPSLGIHKLMVYY